MNALEIVMFCLMVPFVLWGAAYTRRRNEEMKAATDAAWRTAADRLGGRYDDSSKHILATVKGVQVEVDRATVGEATHTRLVARARVWPELSLHVTRSPGQRGSKDVQVGNPSFDHDYLIETNDPDAARMWLNAEVRKLIRRAPDFHFQLDDGSVVAGNAKIEQTADAIVAAVRAVAAMCDGRQRLLRAWRELARPHGGTVTSVRARWATARFELDGIPITIDTTIIDGHHYTTACAQVVGAALTPFVLAIDDRFLPSGDVAHVEALPGYSLWFEDPSVRARLTAKLVKVVADLEPLAIRVEESEVVVTLPGICIDHDELLKASSLAAALAAGEGQGPYR